MWHKLRLVVLHVGIVSRNAYTRMVKGISPLIHLLYWPSLLVSIAFCLRWIRHVPSAGIAIGALGAAGVLVAIKGEKLQEGHKVIWAFITLVFLVTEIRAIKNQDEQHANTMQALVDSYKDAKTQNQTHFDSTMRQLDSHTSRLEILSKSEEHVESLSKQNLKNITGGDSYAYVSPQNFFGDQFPGMVWNNGEQALIGLTLTIAHTSDPNWGEGFYRPILIGTVGAYESAPIPNFVFQPRADAKTGQDGYWIMLSAQNGTVSQSLWFRRDRKNPANWAYSFQVTKQNVYKPQTEKMLTKPWKGTRTFKSKLLLYRAWCRAPR